METILKLLSPRNLWKLLLAVFIVVVAIRLIPSSVEQYAPDSDANFVRETDTRHEQPPRTSVQNIPEVKIGQTFSSLDQLDASQIANGYLRTGRFGNQWPATVTEVLKDKDGISFTRKNGTPHTYSGFDGYRMQVVRLVGPGGAEVLVVFRSMAKD